MVGGRGGVKGERRRSERLPERLLRDGPRSLSDAELVAVLLHSSFREGSAFDFAHELLRDLGGLAGLGEADGHVLERDGVGSVRGAVLLAIREVAARLGRSKLIGRQVLDRPAEVASYVSLRYAQADQEVLGVLFLDNRHRLITEHELYRGALSHITVEPRQVLRAALRHSASSIVPSHDNTAQPSERRSETLGRGSRLHPADGFGLSSGGAEAGGSPGGGWAGAVGVDPTAATSNTDGFEFFHGHISQSSSKPQITVRRGGLMVFTLAAVEMLGDDVTHIQLAYDANRGAVGIRTANQDTAGAYRLRTQGKNPGRVVGGKRFFKHYGLSTDTATRYDARDFGKGIIGFLLDGSTETATADATAKTTAKTTAEAEPATNNKPARSRKTKAA